MKSIIIGKHNKEFIKNARAEVKEQQTEIEKLRDAIGVLEEQKRKRVEKKQEAMLSIWGLKKGDIVKGHTREGLTKGKAVIGEARSLRAWSGDILNADDVTLTIRDKAHRDFDVCMSTVERQVAK